MHGVIKLRGRLHSRRWYLTTVVCAVESFFACCSVRLRECMTVPKPSSQRAAVSREYTLASVWRGS
eukprot:145812-Chlamydomonas_euryale.AAC.5